MSYDYFVFYKQVGLAVDNIKEVQEQAELTRKAMQVSVVAQTYLFKLNIKDVWMF